jgi:hypothetical protein
MEKNNIIAKLHRDGLNDTWIADYVGVPVERVKVVIAIGPVKPSELYIDPVYVKAPSQPRAKRVVRRQAFKPLTGNETVIDLVARGLSAEKIKKRMGVTVTARQILRYAQKKLGRSRTGSLSVENQISTSFMPYVVECLRRLGKDPFWCECCEEKQAKRCIVHHTRYEGATIDDMAYVCSSCNNSRENRGLS